MAIIELKSEAQLKVFLNGQEDWEREASIGTAQSTQKRSSHLSTEILTSETGEKSQKSYGIS